MGISTLVWIDSRRCLVCAGIYGVLAVTLGAFGAHGLTPYLAAEALQTYRTGVDYHFYHLLALLVVGVYLSYRPQSQALKIGAFLLMLGIPLFSGSLYLLALSQVAWLGILTPLGGLCLIGAWLCIVFAAWGHRPR